MKPVSKIGIFILSTALIMFSSCGHDNAWYEKHNPKKLALKEADVFFDYLKAKDVENLIELFADNVKSSHDLKNEFDEFFKHIDGDIQKYDSISFPGEGMGIDKDGNIYDSHLEIQFNNVETSTGGIYTINYYQRRIYLDNKSSEGINVVELTAIEKGGEIYYPVGEIID